MILTLKLTPEQEGFLRRRAAEAGLAPADYLLAAAGLMPQFAADPETPTGDETDSAYDLFRDLTGGFASGGANLSEGVVQNFAEGMAGKQREGHL